LSLRIKILNPILIFVFFAIQNLIFAQPFQRELNRIPVSDATGLIPNTFSGGHNNLEPQFVDIDADDDFDIFFLDSDRTFGWYENVGDKFNAQFEYSLIKISGMFFSDWFYFVDIDDDDDYDYFTGNVDKISLYENTGTVSNPSYIQLHEIVMDSAAQPIFSEFGSNPVFVDVDGDLDFDFITGNTSGTLTFYENIGTPQNLNFAWRTNVWQDIVIIGRELFDPRHGASSIDFVDIDNDDDLDLFWGDFFSNSLYVIENQGTQTSPYMQLISNVYPVNEDSIYTSGFNMPRFADIDNDADFDLFVSVLFNSTVTQSLMFYENNGTPEIADHNLVTEDYLQTLDVVNNSITTFTDIDADGDLDLFSGSFNSPVGSIHFMENVGTITQPAFEYLDSSYFGIGNDLSVSPTFGDLDGDNDIDMIVGWFTGKLSVYWNTGNVNVPEFINSDSLVNNLGDEIDIGASASPLLIDIDKDDDYDLIIGGFNGKFDLYKNSGSINNYIFEKDTFYFSLTDTTFLDVGDFSTPFLFDFNKDGAYDLFSGNRFGKFYQFENLGTNQNPVWNEITDQFIIEQFGGITAPYFVDIDADTDMDLFLGNVKGGLYLYNNTEISTVDKREIIQPVQFSVEAFPNPFNPKTTILLYLAEGRNITIDIYNILGEKINRLFKGFLRAGEHNFEWDGTNESGSILSSGNYIIYAYTEQMSKTFKVSFLK
jgi:hypothetical protein